MATIAPDIAPSTGSLLENLGAHRVLVDAAPAPFDIISSKISIPVPRPDSIVRTALVNRLRAKTSTSVISLIAPAGYGKTTLLCQWSKRDDRPFIWLTADTRDDDPVVLLRHLAAAVDRVSPIDREVWDALVVPGASIWTSIVPRLARAISRMPEPVVFVLDDAHLIRSCDSADAIYALAGHLPRGSVFTVAGRMLPLLPIASLRAERRLLEVRPDDLALTRRETELMLRDAHLELSPAQIDELTRQTEGWAVALSLVILSLTNASSGNDRDTSPAAHDEFVAEYLESQYFSNLTPDELEFLRKAAVLDHVCAPLCDAVFDVTDSAATIDTLGRSSLFLVPLDSEREWYRCHRMLRDLLRRHVADRDPNAIAALHQRAADWFESHHDRESALEHASSAGDLDRVARLTWALAMTVYQDGRIATVERWLKRFDDDGLLERYPEVAAHGARVHALCGRTEESERWLAAAEEGAREPGRDASEIDGWIAVVRAATCRDGVEQMLVDAELALERLSERSEWRPAALLLRGAAHAFTDDRELAHLDFTEAARAADRLGHTGTRMLADGERSLLAEDAGDLDPAAGAPASADSLFDEAEWDAGLSTAAIHLAASARAELRLGHWDAARTLLARAQHLTPLLTDAIPWLAVQARLELARAYVTLRDAAATRALLAEIDDVLERRPALGSLVDDVAELRAQVAAIPQLDPGRASGLTGAELRLLPLLATHLSFREIGVKLYVSRNTIKTQAISVYRKLGVCTRTDAVERASELGLIEADVAVPR